MNTTASFLRRWSRLKLHGGDRHVEAPDVKGAALPLPAPETLDFNADFSLFMRDGVDGETRRNALRKLFMTDHYRAMDGLDVYVEDYSRPALLSSDLLQTLDHAQALLKKTEQTVAEAATEALPDQPESV